MIQTVLGFDFGEQRIGVASGQTITAQASPLTTLKAVQQKPDWQAIARLIEQWRPDALIVGIPTYLDGSDSDMTKRARRFRRQLEGRFNLPTFEVNESLTSFEAEQALKENKKSGKHNKQDIDKMAAAIIVQSWLEQNT